MNDILIIALKVLGVLTLVALNGFFVAAEFALVKVRDTQLDPLIVKKNRRAKVARAVLHRQDTFLSAAQLGITLTSLGLGWVGEPVFSTLLHPVFGWLHIQSKDLQDGLSFVVGFSCITFLHISAGEQAPKLLAIQKPLPTVLWIAYPLLWFYRVSYPFVMVLNWASQWMLRQIGLQGSGEHEGKVSDEELRLLFSTSQPQGGTKLGRDIVLNALDLRHRVVREVMRPRQEIVAFNTEAAVTECLERAEKTRYSRFPLCDGGDLDKTRGLVHIKDLYAARDKARRGADLIYLTRKLIYVPESARLEKLLKLLLERKLHMAIVVDEFGGTTGLVTLENILEELVGQIQDEFDQEKPQLIPAGEGIWEAMGTLPLHELEKIVGEPLRDEGITTASGWLTHRLGGFPKAGDLLNIGEYELRVMETDGPRVEKLKISKRDPESMTLLIKRKEPV